MKLLVVEPTGFHEKFNSNCLHCLETIASVTYAAPEGFLDSFKVDKRISIPQKVLQHRTKLGARWSAIRTLGIILKSVDLDDFDATVFLAYESISFLFRWPRNRKVFLFEHNNIENALKSRIKTFFYRHLNSKAIHITFQHHVVQYIHENFQRKAFRVPFPSSQQDACESTNFFGSSALFQQKKPIVIFSPSGGTSENIQDALRRFVSAKKDAFYAICKGKYFLKSFAWEVRSYFDDYETLMHSSDLVFVGVRYNYRISAVAYEALGYGKLVVLLDCLFARELKKEYPGLVFVVEEVDEIAKIVPDVVKMRSDWEKYLAHHSIDAFRNEFTEVLKAAI